MENTPLLFLHMEDTPLLFLHMENTALLLHMECTPCHYTLVNIRCNRSAFRGLYHYHNAQTTRLLIIADDDYNDNNADFVTNLNNMRHVEQHHFQFAEMKKPFTKCIKIVPSSALPC